MIRHILSSGFRPVLFWLFVAGGLFLTDPQSICARSLCATVKIEIRQELTLERQAFDAHMRINNGLAHASIENVTVEVHFSDESGRPVRASSDPDDTGALFFIRTETMNHISDVSGRGKVAPETSADIHWLIIPAPGASGGRESGTLYFVGATLSYTAAGKSETIEVAPDCIYVKPMPALVLDYFLPVDVFGNDPWTSTVEEPLPFELGLRIRNGGHGYARSLRVQSAQPRIVDNDLGLFIGFHIEGVRVNGEPAAETLLADLGDIAPGGSGVARWIMTSSLTGRMVGFDAEFSHADALGGQMTSLIEAVNTRTLVRSVLVDAPGRDSIEDFLARDDDVLRVYESDTVDSAVSDLSAYAALTGSGAGSVRLTMPSADGFVYAQIPDPEQGRMAIKGAIRSDGKRIRPQNIWLSKTREGRGPWQYSVNIFDFNTTGVYSLVYQDPETVPVPPAIAFIPDKEGSEGQPLSFLVQTVSSPGGFPALSTDRLPVGAVFVDREDGSGVFDWTPFFGQAGDYSVRFMASESGLEAARRVKIRIGSETDRDGDGMPDAWELEYFGSLDRDGTGDYDGDGISDLDEYLNGFDPTTPQNVPGAPVIISPGKGVAVSSLNPELVIAGSPDPEKDPVIYTFEVFDDRTFRQKVWSQSLACHGEERVGAVVDFPLQDESFYYWRVRASDHTGSSLWTYGYFGVDTEGKGWSGGQDEDSGTAVPIVLPAPELRNPGKGAWVRGGVPVLAVHPVRDPEIQSHGSVRYRFELYEDPELTRLVAHTLTEDLFWFGYAPLRSSRWYYWRVQVVDGSGPAGSWSETGAFFAKVHGTIAEGASGFSFLSPESPVHTPGPEISVGWTFDGLQDDELVFYYTDRGYPDEGVPARGRIEKDTDGESGVFLWDTAGLEGTFFLYAIIRGSGTFSRVFCPFPVIIDQTPPKPIAVPAGCRFRETLSVVLEVDEDAFIYYTLDGSEPSEAAALYGDPLLITADTTLRFMAIDRAGNRSAVFTERYTEGPEALVLSVVTDQGRLLTGLGAEVFAQGSMVPVEAVVTDAFGQAHFSEECLTEGIYRFRVTYMGNGFWSEEFFSPGTASFKMILSEKRVAVTVLGSGGGLAGIPVSICTEDGLCRDESVLTDGEGNAVFLLPVGGKFLFRAELDGHFIWTDAVRVGEGDETMQVVALPASDGSVVLYLGKSPHEPIVGALVRMDSEEGFPGLDGCTDGDGFVSFHLPAGEYRAEILWKGHRFHESVSHGTKTRRSVFIPHREVMVSLKGRFLEEESPLSGVEVNLFTDGGEAVGIYQISDAAGHVVFDLPEKEYEARVEYLGRVYGSGLFLWEDGEIPVPMADVRVGVTSAGKALAGARVVVCREDGESLGVDGLTDADGYCGFRIPEGSYRFMVDHLGEEIWSGEKNLVASHSHTTGLSTGSGNFSLKVESDSGEPLTGVACHLFSLHGADMGQFGLTDGTGRAGFDLAGGRYRIRVDYLGHSFWSDVVEIPGMVESRIGIAHNSVDVDVVTMEGVGSRVPAKNIPVYLHGDNRAYRERHGLTDDDGRASFLLPAGAAFVFRAEMAGESYWSAVVDVPDEGRGSALINGGGGRLILFVLSGSGAPMGGLSVRLYGSGDVWLGQEEETTEDGQAVFYLPEGKYRLQLEYGGALYSTDLVKVNGDVLVTLNLDPDESGACFIGELLR
ncbi:chitobiase/beta-hexosaminidase C-terminal domain-containing protein [Desulfobotulus sp. H1]|uniref:Chitobiase/beta-hexosaminidase C-terminal domain-containing protein n=1 Tax=Desulfobotulus pelophilus TaxID=2823377 RepID=A0ABT3NBR7_9BACT|nr:chitobiase/beta-hexosaminidase C-terminal domain-containing protein [Desulfobotulus pelophilus]MCW7754909.1 chitobiase/beta-hexosaminidase C-terminal domain-containing protein [Desulfobotulus pelophilus]